MIRIPLPRRLSSPALCLIPACALALVLGGCASGDVRPGDIPDVPPLAYSPATEVPAETFTTIPTDPSAGPAPAPPVQTPAAAGPASGPASDQAQRIAALELSLLNMNSELAWLKSQPANATTPWGTPSPKVVPSAPPDTRDKARPAPPAAPPSAQAAVPATTPSAPPSTQTERIATLERNMQAIHEELRGLRGQTAAQTSPWGKPAPTLTVPPAAAAPAPAVAPTATRPPVLPGTPPTQAPAPALAPTPAPAPVPSSAQAAAQAGPPPVPMPGAIPASPANPGQTDPAASAPNDPEGGPKISPQDGSVPHPALAHIPQPAPEAIATPPLRRQNPQASGTAYTYTIPTQTSVSPPPTAQAPLPQTPAAQTPASRSGQAPRPASMPPAPVQTAPATAGTGEQAAYQAALNAFENKNYNDAWNSFDRYLETYPNGRFVPNALYWKGEVRYSLGDYGGAILLFKDVAGRFPQHQKAPDALLKIAMSYDRLRDRDNATLHLRILNEDYPRSEAARRAKSLRLS